jgi:class 3 adenylate cyclase
VGQRAAVPVAERRLVSVLFADLVGFTTLAEGRDAEDTRELLTSYFDLSRDVIGRYGGTSRSSSVTRSWRSGARRPPTRMMRESRSRRTGAG